MKPTSEKKICLKDIPFDTPFRLCDLEDVSTLDYLIFFTEAVVQANKNRIVLPGKQLHIYNKTLLECYFVKKNRVYLGDTNVSFAYFPYVGASMNSTPKIAQKYLDCVVVGTADKDFDIPDIFIPKLFNGVIR